MSRAIYVCSRRGHPDSVEETIEDICRRIAPDNIEPSPPRIAVAHDIAYGVMNPTDLLRVEGRSLLVGQTFGGAVNWHLPLSDFPDGSYALFRDDPEYCEVVADPAATRTIWYYFDDNVFVAAMSQRAIVMYVGSFQFDEMVVPWMLSAGTMGPARSWDRRVQRIAADSSVVLDKRRWFLSHRALSQDIRPVRRPDGEHKELLRASVGKVFSSFSWNSPSWALTLSGGHDSRGVLCFLNETGVAASDIRTITWGSAASPSAEGNDARIAAELAQAMGAPHQYYRNEQADESIEDIIDRFIRLGEARRDHVSGYMDGFHMWKAVFENGIRTIVRGDQAFGSKPSRSERGVRRHGGWPLWSDYPNLRPWRDHIPEQTLAGAMRRQSGESIQMWGDRLRIVYRIPTNLGALSDLKSPYVDQVSPLLSREILRRVRELPDHLRADRRLWKDIVAELGPDLPFAVSAANLDWTAIFRRDDMMSLLSSTLESDSAKGLFEPELLKFVGKGLKKPASQRRSPGKSRSLRSGLKGLIPSGILKTLRTNVTGTAMDHNRLAFRILIVARIRQLLMDDSLIR
jgi:hypothetical protein